MLNKAQFIYVGLSLLAVITVKFVTFGVYFLIAHLQNMNKSADPFNYFR